MATKTRNKSGAGKSPGRKKRKQKNTANKKSLRQKFLIGSFLAGLLIVSLAATIYIIFLRTWTSPLEAEKKQVPEIAATVKKKPTQQTAKSAPAVSVPEKSAKQEKRIQIAKDLSSDKPRVAIIIDDMGYRRKVGNRLINMDLNLTFSFLPEGPFTGNLSQKAGQLGKDILLHLPLEPSDPTWNLGPGGIYLSMNRNNMRSIFVQDLDAVPMAIGVNNHMGSRFTENEQAMKYLLSLIRQNNLFFVDSITSSKSLGFELARNMGIKTAERNVFLDNDPDREKIEKQIKSLLTLAKKRGHAIGIGHPNPETFEALKSMEKEIKENVNIVGVSKLVK